MIHEKRETIWEHAIVSLFKVYSSEEELLQQILRWSYSSREIWRERPTLSPQTKLNLDRQLSFYLIEFFCFAVLTVSIILLDRGESIFHSCHSEINRQREDSLYPVRVIIRSHVNNSSVSQIHLINNYSKHVCQRTNDEQKCKTGVCFAFISALVTQLQTSTTRGFILLSAFPPGSRTVSPPR